MRTRFLSFLFLLGRKENESLPWSRRTTEKKITV
uniref:Uncharacterized protein n=1 Tax=Anguilla anguilla TaxID=7936 RepID=A0A0E9XE43_ANGAN